MMSINYNVIIRSWLTDYILNIDFVSELIEIDCCQISCENVILILEYHFIQVTYTIYTSSVSITYSVLYFIPFFLWLNGKKISLV